jgi:hypothetical protein
VIISEGGGDIVLARRRLQSRNFGVRRRCFGEQAKPARDTAVAVAAWPIFAISASPIIKPSVIYDANDSAHRYRARPIWLCVK